MKNKFNYFLLFLFILTILSCFANATRTDGSSNSPEDEWWMVGGNNNFTRYTSANAPSNLSNTTIITRTMLSTVSGAPTIVGDSLFILPDGMFSSSRPFELNATNISKHISNGTASITMQGASPTYFNGSFYIHSSGSIIQINASNLSQTLSSASISDAFYYAVPVVHNYSVYVGDGNSVPRFRQYNHTNVSTFVASLSVANRIYASAPMPPRSAANAIGSIYQYTFYLFKSVYHRND